MTTRDLLGLCRDEKTGSLKILTGVYTLHLALCLDASIDTSDPGATENLGVWGRPLKQPALNSLEAKESGNKP